MSHPGMALFAGVLASLEVRLFQEQLHCRLPLFHYCMKLLLQSLVTVGQE
jgi:hypothetical protein